MLQCELNRPRHGSFQANLMAMPEFHASVGHENQPSRGRNKGAVLLFSEYNHGGVRRWELPPKDIKTMEDCSCTSWRTSTTRTAAHEGHSENGETGNQADEGWPEAHVIHTQNQIERLDQVFAKLASSRKARTARRSTA